MINITNYDVEPSRELLSDNKIQNLKIFYSVVLLISLALMTFTILMNSEALRLVVESKNAFKTLALGWQVTFTISIISIFISLISYIILKIALKYQSTILTCLVSIPSTIFSFFLALNLAILTKNSVMSFSANKNFIESSNSKESDQLLQSIHIESIGIVSLLSVGVILSLILFNFSLQASFQSFKRLPDRAIYSTENGLYIIENATYEYSSQVGQLFSNEENILWNERNRSSSMIKEWLFFVDTVDYRKRVRILRHENEVLALLLQSENNKYIDSYHFNSNFPDRKLAQMMLVQDFARRYVDSNRPIESIKLPSEDNKIKYILTQSGWAIQNDLSNDKSTVLTFGKI